MSSIDHNVGAIVLHNQVVDSHSRLGKEVQAFTGQREIWLVIMKLE